VAAKARRAGNDAAERSVFSRLEESHATWRSWCEPQDGMAGHTAGAGMSNFTRRNVSEREALIKLSGRIDALNDVADIIAAAGERLAAADEGDSARAREGLRAALEAVRRITMECATLSDDAEEAFLDLAEQMYPGRSFAQH